MIEYAYYDSPLGPIQIGHEDGSIVSIRRRDTVAEHRPSPVSDFANKQLQSYFEGSLRTFQLPIAPRGTTFQMAVWQALLEIPFGETRTYGQIAAAIGKPKASRAVGQAINRNPLWIVIPCHRVIGQDNSLTGYAGGLEMKRFLLELEQKR